jgi:hypothetical protein
MTPVKMPEKRIRAVIAHGTTHNMYWRARLDASAWNVTQQAVQPKDGLFLRVRHATVDTPVTNVNIGSVGAKKHSRIIGILRMGRGNGRLGNKVAGQFSIAATTPIV